MSAFTVGSPAVTRVANSFWEKTVVARFAGPTSYDTGGSLIDLSQSGLGSGALAKIVDGAHCEGVEAVGGAIYRLCYLRAANGDPTAGKFVVYNQAGEVAGATNLSAIIFLIKALGA